jgi:hypothetical protein
LLKKSTQKFLQSRLAVATREPQTFQRAMQLQDIQGTHLVPEKLVLSMGEIW